MLSAITKSQIKYVRALQIKKNRYKEQCFLVEGSKNVLEFLNSTFSLKLLIGTSDFFESVSNDINLPGKAVVAKVGDIERMGTFKTNKSCLAVFEMKKPELPDNEKSEMGLVLDSINDPGNLGTIIRVADWYNVGFIVISKDTADPYHPKVINASMGSFSRVPVYPCDIRHFLENQDWPVYAAVLDGVLLDEVTIQKPSLILLGNESHGINHELLKLAEKKITIKKYGSAESLNVAVAAGIILQKWSK